MRLPRPRISVRRMMIVVAVLGVVSWLGITALLVARDPNAEQMSHLRQRLDTDAVVVHTHPIVGVFWPRYWRRLLGRPWPGSYICPTCRERYERTEKHPLIDLAASDHSAEMIDAMRRINQERLDA